MENEPLIFEELTQEEQDYIGQLTDEIMLNAPDPEAWEYLSEELNKVLTKYTTMVDMDGCRLLFTPITN